MAGTTQLQLYNGALRLCEERRLATLTENRAPRRLLDSVWAESPWNNWLEEGNWQFATKTVKLDYDDDFEADFGYARQFTKPDDWVRTVALSANEYFSEPYQLFREESGFWYCDLDELYVSYISNDAEYGYDLTLWTPSFVRFAQADLAVEINPRLTGSRVATNDLIEIRRKRLSEAQGKDSVGRPATKMPTGSWVKSRTRGSVRERTDGTGLT